MSVYMRPDGKKVLAALCRILGIDDRPVRSITVIASLDGFAKIVSEELITEEMHDRLKVAAEAARRENR